MDPTPSTASAGPGDGTGWIITLGHIAAIVAAAVVVYLPSFGNPLRLWDHHVMLLLAKAPQFRSDLFWHLVHYRIGFGGFGDDTMYFRVLSMPVTWALAWLYGDASVLYYTTQLLLHIGVAVVLYVLAIELGCDRMLATLVALLFCVYGGQGDTVNLPVYTFMLLSLLLAGLALLGYLRYLRTGQSRLLAVSIAALTVATLLYDAFLLLTLMLPVLAVAISIRREGGRGRAVATPLSVLAGVVLVLALVLASMRLAPAMESGPPPGAARSVRSTMDVLLRDARMLRAAGFAVEALAADAQVFLTGHRPAIWHRGNLPYWDLGALRRLRGRLHLALGLVLAGLAVLAGRSKARRHWRLIGIALLAAGAWVDWRTTLLAPPLALAVWGGRRILIDPRLALVAAAGLVVSFNIALGRADGYNVVAFRHHYVTGFFVVLALSALLGAGATGRSGLRRRLCLLALSVAVIVNAAVTVAILDGVRLDNAMVFAFDRDLTGVRERHGPGSVFVAFSPSMVRGADWRGFPLQDVAFDILHFSENPMTRYTSQARLVAGADGQMRPNALLGAPDRGDFLVRFRLTGLPPGPYEIFGASAREPRIILSAAGVALQVRRRIDGVPVRWDFPIVAATLPAVVSLGRAGDTLRVMEGTTMIGRAALPPREAYHGWESDNAALLGRGFERVAAGGLIYDTYIRIGPAPAQE
jgi:hypothetical protein